MRRSSADATSQCGATTIKDDTPYISSRSPADVGSRIAAIRRAKGLTLARIASVCGLSEPTLSRIENGRSSISAHNLFALARFMEVDVAEFFRDDSAPLSAGKRSVTRAGAGVSEVLERYAAEVLCADLSHKEMHPAINTVTARTLDEVGGLAHHDGEEFLYVLEGRVVIHSALYAPLELSAGDSLYFDGSTGHAYLAADDQPARILVVVRCGDGGSL